MQVRNQRANLEVSSSVLGNAVFRVRYRFADELVLCVLWFGDNQWVIGILGAHPSYLLMWTIPSFGPLGTKQIPIPNAIRYVRAMFDAGNTLYLWSRGGAAYSKEIAIKLKIEDCFVGFLPKPEIVLDDRLVNLLDHCEFLHPSNVDA